MQFTKSIFMYARGEEVVSMQDLLSSLNEEYNFTNRKIESTGYFGFDTVHIVRDFQNFFGLPPSGAFDYQTWYTAETKYGDMIRNLQKQSPPSKPEPKWANQRKW
ncbi:MAG: peptidoglycan-binding protein [Pyrinomonadaceae bacterium]|nr:peptidoglycan-binding protein [Pyrinomonadaceae bacterium]